MDQNQVKEYLNKEYFTSESKGKDDEVIKLIVSKLVRRWKLLALCVAISLCLCFIYLRYATPIYGVDAQVLIEDDKNGGLSSSSTLTNGILGDLAGLTSGLNVNNESKVLTTRLLLRSVVKDLELNVSYVKKGTLNSIEIYKENPYDLKIVEIEDTIRRNRFNVDVLKNGDFHIYDDDTIDLKVKDKDSFRIDKVGTFKISKNPVLSFSENDANKYAFSIRSTDQTVAQLFQQLTVTVSDKNASIIDLYLTYPLPAKGEDILDRLINNYLYYSLQSKNQIADSTLNFISGRLDIVGNELNDIETNIKNFKQSNEIADIDAQSKALIDNYSAYYNDIAKIEAQIAMLDEVRKYVQDTKSNHVVPAGIVQVDPVFEGIIAKYNELLLQYERASISQTNDNPFVVSTRAQIDRLRKDILTNLNNSKNALLANKKDMDDRYRSLGGQIKSVPSKEKVFRDLERQQKIKEELYVFLLQKREETAISKTSNIANARVIDPAKSEVSPTSPKKIIVLLAGIILGLFFPVVIIYGQEILDSKIRSKVDITNKTDVSVIGEISHNQHPSMIVVDKMDRSALAEQFRSIRTNLQFYNKAESGYSILLTSSMSGEGKSFISINLANILSLSKKRVVLLELDLRKPKISTYLNIDNSKGLSNHFIGSVKDINEIIVKSDLNSNFYIIPSGPIPPNPAELLLNDNVRNMFSYLRKHFDYIIIDAPPIGLVTDAQMLSDYTDLALYIVRDGFTLKNQVNIVEELHQKQKFKKIAIVINDVPERRGYDYGYGYGYGYSYGYGYGYGSTEVKRSWLKRIFKFKGR